MIQEHLSSNGVLAEQMLTFLKLRRRNLNCFSRWRLLRKSKSRNQTYLILTFQCKYHQEVNCSLPQNPKIETAVMLARSISLNLNPFKMKMRKRK